MRLQRLVVGLGVMVATGVGTTASAAAPDGRKLVVVFYPNESDRAPGLIQTDHAIRSTFATEAPWRIDIRNEYVDTSRLIDPQFKKAQIDFLHQKYAGRKVNLVMAGLSSALDFVLDHREQLFPGAPVVYIAVDQREIQARRLPPDVKGSPIQMELAKTLEIALRLHPKTRQVYVIAGVSQFDAVWEAEARRALRSYEGKVEVVYLSGLPMAELCRRVATLPENSLIYYLHIFRDGAGSTFVPAEALDLIAEKANAPIYGHVGTYVGRGIVGGRVFDFELAGQHAGRLAIGLLKGEEPASLSIADAGSNSTVFDWRQLQRWGVDEGNLPPGSLVRYRKVSFWDQYKWYAIGIACVGAFQIIMISVLIAQLIKRRRAEERFRRVIETVPTGMLLVNDAGNIALVNSGVEKLFGYGREELIGRPMEWLVPGWSRSLHPGHEVIARRNDGHDFPLDVTLTPLHTSQGAFTLVSILDLTERRQAEQRALAGQKELRKLTGRLLEAQEAERRRVARELHDDMNQELALLAIEAELLASPVPSDDPALAVNPRILALRIKELSSAVHELSHQLHPSKLELLGLVAAVKHLCKELRERYNLIVEYAYPPELATLPPDVALCLYRIVQESLRNVIRHSGSLHATVELAVKPDTICLIVSDAGCGFDPQTATGLGLISMRERLQLVGGEIAIESRPSHGTRIRVCVPLTMPTHSEMVIPAQTTVEVDAADSLTENIP